MSLVPVFLSLATTPMSPACSRGTSRRSRPRGIATWFSFSLEPRSGLYASIPLTATPLKTRKYESSPTCGSVAVLKTSAANDPSSLA